MIGATGLLLASCESDPALVYVPTEPARVFVAASLSAEEVRVGEKVILYASRVNKGRWKQVKRNSLPRDACWLSRPPLDTEDAVADSIHWTVQPEGYARFNIDYRADHTRTVAFSAPGEYRIRGSSAVSCGPPQAVMPETLLVVVNES